MSLFRKASAVFLTASVLLTSTPALASVTGDIQGGLDTAAGSFKTSRTLPEIIGSVIQTLLSFVGVLLLGYLLYGGFRWMTAGGDTSKVKEARQYITNAIIGLVIIVASYAIATFVLDQLTTISTGVTAEAPPAQ